MLYLILAICSSAVISILMRLSSDKVKGNVAMLSMNYLMCMILAGAYTGFDRLFPADGALPQTLVMGALHGILYLASFVLLQVNVKRNGVVLSATFMKLGLLVPMVLSLLVFREQPTLWQILGFCIAVFAILLINLEKGQTVMGSKLGLLLLLVGGGCADAMSKVYEELGSAELSAQFLFYTFVVAFLLCVGLTLLKKQRWGKNEVIYGLLIGIPNFFSARFLLMALEEVKAVIAYPTYSVATILLVTLTGVLAFKERLGKRQWLALGVILVALVLLNL